MDLKEFVAKSIIGVTKGVIEAQEQLSNTKVRVNPKPGQKYADPKTVLYFAENGAAVFPMTFDVAISADVDHGKQSFGIKVLGIDFAVEDGSNEASSKVSRLSFTVPIAYPFKQLED